LKELSKLFTKTQSIEIKVKMLNEIEISNYNEICRLCLKKENENNTLINLINDIDLIQKFRDVTTVIVM